MKTSAAQQQEIRWYLERIVVSKSNTDELFDHVLSDLEQRPVSEPLRMDQLKRRIDQEFVALINTEAELKQYSRRNTIAGFCLFIFALLVYWATMEPTVSFWDCGEFIAAAFKLEVGHQPGAPLFMMIGKLFSLLALGDTAKVAYWVNFLSVVSSAATIMFLFWTITALVRKVYQHEKIQSKTISILVAGAIGAAAYTFSDTFWFSAVEAEVYALSSLFTAVTFWAILKWEQHVDDRWLILIAFLVGLSTGVHLLNLLAIPAIALVYYYRKVARPTWKGSLTALLFGCLILGLIQVGLLQYFVLATFKADLLFVNVLGFPYGSGVLFFILLVAGLLIYGIRFAVRKQRYSLNMGLLCTAFVMLGFSSYTIIMLRAQAKPTINLSNPDNAYSLYNYLSRSNYGSTPLLYGNTFDAQSISNEVTGKTYRKGQERYEEAGNTYKTHYDKNLLFPRTYSQKAHHVAFYQQWLNLQEGESPSFTQNLGFFASWQVGVMYWRYFLWNFSGRQNDVQGFGGIQNGNWITGISALDELRLGSQSNLPPSVINNEGRNFFYGFPLLLGLAGIFWLYKRNRQVLGTVLTLFFFTGLAIIVYLNQDPMQVRERDYAYVGSFYAFAIFIGFGFLLVKDLLQRLGRPQFGLFGAGMACFVAVPLLMGIQGWDDHDRSGKTTALDWAKNYLNSCAPNAILITNADNDTYPLWYAQEVEGIRTDVRVVNYQFLHDPSFIDQLKGKVNDSEALPLSLTHDQYKAGVRDFFPYNDYGITDSVELSELLAVMTSEHQNDKVQMMDGSFMNFLPVRKLKLTVDPLTLLETKTVRPDQLDQVVSTLEWNFDKSYATKADLILMDLLVNNEWERPIYFAGSVSADTYMGLEDYLYLEGYAHRLLPLKKKDDEQKEQRTNSDVMHSNVVNKFVYSGFHNAKYLDEESRRVAGTTWQLNNALTENLLEEGKTRKAADVMAKSLKELPMRNYSIADTLIKLRTVKNLYELKQTEQANALVAATADFLSAELQYLSGMALKHQNAYVEDIQIGIYVLDELEKMTAAYQQGPVRQKLNTTLDRVIRGFEVEG